MQYTEKVRLENLIKCGVVDPKAGELTLTFIGKLYKKYAYTLNSQKVQMLSTHMAIALTRILRKELIEQNFYEEIKTEIKSSPYLAEAKDEITWLSQKLGEEIPDHERAYLYLHYISLLQDINLRKEVTN
ncbi:PRD domain-containing protein [Bacillus thuringiensis]|uniref:PRD domain-containing protein n=1 Tax=Bacillus thuringiensis TaxID=1428 RepID=UPI0025412301|nr:PRD domain-containing protein [Bacillus thuringiensis]WIG15491.1 PRD domain-containing protein [Bacillus thuringiensis]